jgi:hypothetical protein
MAKKKKSAKLNIGELRVRSFVTRQAHDSRTILAGNAQIADAFTCQIPACTGEGCSTQGPPKPQTTLECTE